MRRGEVWWANLPPPVGRRPVLLLTRNAAYTVRNAVTVAPITRRIRSIPVEVRLGKGDGFPIECVANLDTILTIPKAKLAERITELSAEKMQAVDKAILYALGVKL